MEVFNLVDTREDENVTKEKIKSNWHGSLEISLKLIVASRNANQSFSLIDEMVKSLQNEDKRVTLAMLTRYEKISGINDCLKTITNLTPEFIKTLSMHGHMYGADAAWFDKISNYFRKEAMNMFGSTYRLREALVSNDCILIEESISTVINSLTLIIEIVNKLVGEFSKAKNQMRDITQEDGDFWKKITATSRQVAELKKALPPAYKISMRQLVKRAQVEWLTV